MTIKTPFLIRQVWLKLNLRQLKNAPLNKMKKILKVPVWPDQLSPKIIAKSPLPPPPSSLGGSAPEVVLLWKRFRLRLHLLLLLPGLVFTVFAVSDLDEFLLLLLGARRLPFVLEKVKGTTQFWERQENHQFWKKKKKLISILLHINHPLLILISSSISGHWEDETKVKTNLTN